jgi:hypothetical protein
MMRILSGLVLFLIAPHTAIAAELRLVLDDSTVVSRSLDGPIEPGDLEHVDHAWVWSDVAAARRVPTAALRDRDSLIRSLAASDRMTLRFARQDGRKIGAVTIISAPAEMWEEVPEPLLPHMEASSASTTVPYDPKSTQRVRGIAGDVGSTWITVLPGVRQAVVPLAPASDVVARISGEGAGSLDAVVRIAVPAAGMVEAQPLAMFQTTKGVVRIASLPQTEAKAIQIESSGFVPFSDTEPVASLAPEVKLVRGATLTARFATAKGVPIPAVKVRAEWWSAHAAAQILHVDGRAGVDGRLELRGVPKGDIALIATAAGFGRSMRKIAIESEAMDAGTITLSPAASLQVRAVDDLKRPVKGAVVESGDLRVETDGRGMATFTGLDGAAPFRDVAHAQGHLRAIASIDPPLPREQLLVLRRSLRVKGRYDAPAPALLIRQGHRESQNEIASDGSFDVDLDPALPVELVFHSPSAHELLLPVAAGTPGEVRDLGRLVPPPGAAVRGRVVAADSGRPVAGARVWALRASMPALAWARGDLISATTDENGGFTLSGADSLPVLLHVDADGFARAYQSASRAGESDDADVGDISLSRGGTVHVKAPGASDGAMARVDLRGELFDADFLDAPLRDGEASIAHVPNGSVGVLVEKTGSVLCEQSVDVRDDATAEVRCETKHPLVKGSVRVGGRPADGILRWERAVGSHEGVIMTRMSEGGLSQQQVAGGGGSSLSVMLDDGSFETRDLAEGEWSVSWLPDSGGLSSSRSVVVTSAEEQTVTLEYENGTVHGQVVDRNGAGLERASVMVDGAGGSISRADGTFIVPGLAPGDHKLRARRYNDASDTVVFRIDAERETPPVTVVIDRSATEQPTVRVVDANGQPVAGAVVIAQLENGPVRLLTTDAAGTTQIDVPADQRRFRAAATMRGLWSLGVWSDDSERVLRFGETGDLVIESETAATPSIAAATGWDLSMLFATLGARPQAGPGHPLQIRGLPIGVYTIGVGVQQQVVEVRSDQTANVKFK